MARQRDRWASIDDYIAAAPPETQERLRTLRAAIRAAAPDATETTSYGMPAFAQNGTLVYFAARKDGIGFYPTSSGIAAFQDELSRYASTKGAVRFPLDRPLPLDLIQRIVRFRVEETRQKAATAQGRAPSSGGGQQAVSGFPTGVAAPARRALAAAGYTELRQLVGVPVAELHALHGMGPTALARLQAALAEEGLALS